MIRANWRVLLGDALRAWSHYRLQGFLSVLGVIAGFGGLVLVLTLGEGARREIDAALAGLGAGTLVVRSPAGLAPADRIEPARVEALTRLLGERLRRVVPVILRQQTLTLPGLRVDQVRVVGTSPGYATLHRLAVDEGRFLGEHDLTRRQPACAAGAELGRTLRQAGVRLGDPLRVGGRHCQLVGYLQPVRRPEGGGALQLPDFDRAIYLPWATLGDPATLRIDELVVGFHSEQELLRATPALQRILEQSRQRPLLEYLVPAELLRQKLRLQQVTRALLASASLLLLVVGTVGITNMMQVNVLRRRPEIGLRVAVGATRSDIIAQFVTESMLVAGAGGLLGLTLGLLAALALGGWLGWAVAVPVASVATALLVTTALGLLAGTYPALQAAALEPVRALNQG